MYYRTTERILSVFYIILHSYGGDFRFSPLSCCKNVNSQVETHSEKEFFVAADAHFQSFRHVFFHWSNGRVIENLNWSWGEFNHIELCLDPGLQYSVNVDSLLLEREKSFRCMSSIRWLLVVYVRMCCWVDVDSQKLHRIRCDFASSDIKINGYITKDTYTTHPLPPSSCISCRVSVYTRC